MTFESNVGLWLTTLLRTRTVPWRPPTLRRCLLHFEADFGWNEERPLAILTMTPEQMSIQICLLPKGLPTVVADVVSDFEMNFEMHWEGGVPAELPPTVEACEVFFLCVREEVTPQVSLLREALLAGWTWKGPFLRVRHHVNPDMGLPREALPADLALKRFLSAVAQDVSLEMCLAFEGLPALPALGPLPNLMHPPPMTSNVLLRTEQFPALFTGLGLCGEMGLGVSAEFGCLLEQLPADRAGEGQAEDLWLWLHDLWSWLGFDLCLPWPLHLTCGAESCRSK